MKKYKNDAPIRGKTVFKGNVPPLDFTLSRETEDGTREIDHFEADGTRYMPVAEKDFDSEVEHD